MPVVGRGGAGNILALQEESRRSTDLEATIPGGPVHEPVISSAKPQQYAHTGRGGAGNYYSPAALQATGEFANAHTSHIFGDGTPAPTDTATTADQQAATVHDSRSPVRSSAESRRSVGTIPVVRASGRGGAGNFSFGVPESEMRAAQARIEDEKRREAQIKADSERDVSNNLAMPPKAKLAAGEL